MPQKNYGLSDLLAAVENSDPHEKEYLARILEGLFMKKRNPNSVVVWTILVLMFPTVIVLSTIYVLVTGEHMLPVFLTALVLMFLGEILLRVYQRRFS